MWHTIRTIPLCIFLVFIICSSGFATNGDADQAEKGEVFLEEEYEFPSIKPSLSLSGGYRFVNLNGSPRADEYEYLHDSLTFEGGARLFSFPHRFDLDFDLKNKKDYFGDISYSFKDIFVMRGITRSVFHNLSHIQVIDLDPSTASPGIDMRDENNTHGIRAGISDLFVKFKTPDYPFHVYADGNLITYAGNQQQRSLLGSGYYNDILRTTQSRTVDSKTKSMIIGANSHLGPVEVDFFHGEKRFDPGDGKVLFDSYTPAGFPPLIVSPGGTFAHNLIPELKSSSNTLRLHTSLTGSIVGTATFSKTDTENKDSGATTDYFIGSGEVTWIPMPKLVFAVKYRHREIDADSPGLASLTDVSSMKTVAAYTVKPPLSSVTDTVSGTVRYRPFAGLLLRAEYSYENDRRSNADVWEVPESTQRNMLSLYADARVLRNVTVKARYVHKAIDNPEYNTEPDRSDMGSIAVSWTPLPQIMALVSFDAKKEKRSDLQFVGGDSPLSVPQERTVDSDRFLGSLTYIASSDLSCTASYSYFHNRTIQALTYYDLSSVPQVDSQVPYKDTAQNFALDVLYSPMPMLTFNVGVSYTLSNGEFYPFKQDLLEPVSIASFSQFKTRETVVSLSGEYSFKNGFSAGVRYKYSSINDSIDAPDDDISDGRSHILIFTLSKRW